MTTPYKDLEFSSLQNLILLRIKYFGISYKSFSRNEKYSFLRYYSLVKHQSGGQTRLVLNEKGQMYLRYKRRSKIRFWIPVIISIVALFGGYDVYTNPLLEQILQIIAKLVKTITESLGAVF